MNLKIMPITQEYYRIVHAFQCEYLDNEEFSNFLDRIAANPDLYFIALVDNDLAGVCYGHPSNKYSNAINIDGIAVSLDESKGYARQGIGSRLIKALEEAARNKGFLHLGVGAADDIKVEAFYLKNGFIPYELVAKDEFYNELDRVKINNYESGKAVKQKLRDRYKPKEVIFIFRKPIYQ